MVQGGMNTNLTALSDTELDASFKKVGWVETSAVADGIEHLVEVEARKLHLTRGFPGVIDYCMVALGCSRDIAANRVVAAHLVRRYPVVLTMLRERQLCVSGIRVIAQYLSDENYEARLQEASGKTRDELYVLVAAWAPKPDVPTRIVPVKQTPAPELLMRMQETPAPVAAPVEPQRPAPLPKPLSPKRYKIEITVDEETYAALMRQRNNLRHTIPDGDVAKIISRAVVKQDARDEGRKFGKRTRPAKSAKTTKPELPLQLSRD